MQEKINWNLIHRYLSGESTPGEKRELQAWLEEDPAHRQFWESIKKVWEITPEHDVDIDFKEEWIRISRRLGIEFDEELPASMYSVSPHRDSSERGYQQTSYPARSYLRVATVIILIVAGFAIYFADFGNGSPSHYFGTTESEIVMKEIHTARGERARLNFSDGTEVLLNSASTLRFPKVFNKSRREVILQGEAFFNVKYKDDVPFIVITEEADVRVLGTEFNVSSYPGGKNKTVEVVVKEGKVAVGGSTGERAKNGKIKHSRDIGLAREVILNKGQRTVVEKGKMPTFPEKVKLTPYLGWVNGRMIFEETRMREVIQRLRRSYEFNFEVTDSTLLSKRLTASFKRETPERISGLIAFSLGISYELHDDTVIFKPNEERKTQ